MAGTNGMAAKQMQLGVNILNCTNIPQTSQSIQYLRILLQGQTGLLKQKYLKLIHSHKTSKFNTPYTPKRVTLKSVF